ncbi:MAG: class I SAM-dependent methyltransferase [Nitrospirota bacterium]
MTPEEIKKFSSEQMTMLIHGAIGLNTVQGIELGFFDWIPLNKPITAQELSGQLGYDITKVERWLRFAVSYGYINRSDGGYTLTTKGSLLREGTPTPDLLGLHHMFSYFTKAIQHSKDAYQKGVGLDSISQGKISRDYIPRVASQLSKSSAEFFKGSGLSTGHTILDLGCGDGSVLREISRTCPGVSATGIDMNIHTIEQGKRKNSEEGLQDQIDLQVGDVTDMTRFPDNAFDWVYAFNVFHFLPIAKREKFIQDMIRISRYGIFFNQVIANNIQTISVDVLLATLFTDFTGFFSETEADELIKKVSALHHTFMPVIQGESRLVVIYTLKNDIPLNRIANFPEADSVKLTSAGIRTAKGLLASSPEAMAALVTNAALLRKLAIKALFP